MSVLALKLLLFLLDVAGHIRTRRGPDVARGPDVVHHCFRDMNQTKRDRPVGGFEATLADIIFGCRPTCMSSLIVGLSEKCSPYIFEKNSYFQFISIAY